MNGLAFRFGFAGLLLLALSPLAQAQTPTTEWRLIDGPTTRSPELISTHETEEKCEEEKTRLQEEAVGEEYWMLACIEKEISTQSNGSISLLLSGWECQDATEPDSEGNCPEGKIWSDNQCCSSLVLVHNGAALAIACQR